MISNLCYSSWNDEFLQLTDVAKSSITYLSYSRKQTEIKNFSYRILEDIPQGTSCFPLGNQFQYNRLIIDLDILSEFTRIQSFPNLGMFMYCTSLRRITIPANTISLYRQLFRYCPGGVIRFILLPTTPPTLDSNNLWVTPQAIYVPAESINAYKESSYWASYVSLFYPLEE